MTWALCFSCGEIKFGAICPCPACEVASSGDMNLDIAFSDHRLSMRQLRHFGAVVEAINGVEFDPEARLVTFLTYITREHPDMLEIEVGPELQARCEATLASLDLPDIDDIPVESDERPEPDERERVPWQPEPKPSSLPACLTLVGGVIGITLFWWLYL